MKYLKHWKLELFISLASFVLIGLFYFLLSPFFAQVLFVPLLFGILPILLVRRYNLLFCYPFGASVAYTLFLLILSHSWPIDWSLILLALGSVFIPTCIGYLIGFLTIKFLNPAHKWVIPIHILSAFLIIYLSIIHYLAISDIVSYLCLYLFLPLVFIGSQALITLLYPSNRLSPLVNSIIFILTSGFMGNGYFNPLGILYLILAYGTMYILLKILKKRTHSPS